MPQPLSSKEQSLFRQVVRNYEDKHYKKGIKVADQILKKNPKHGDTLAMKALIMNSQGKTEEAFALAKIALQNDMKSHVCWHVYGLLYRAVKNFEEAIKAYKFALRLEPDSAQIQRDLALLQVQMRDYQGYLASRKAMLQARSGVRQSWTALAIAHHLAGDLGEAERTLTAYEETLKHTPSKLDFENSESVMYKNSLIAEQGDYTRALEHLESAGKQNLDRLAILELRAEYLSKLDRKEEAVKAYRALIDRNPEYKTYYDKLVEALGIDAQDHQALKAVYDEYAEKHPRSDAPRRLPLDFLEGEAFTQAAETYVKRMLDKGVPSTFANLKHLYSNKSKKEILPAIVERYIESGKDAENSEPKRHGDTSKGASAAFYFLAQHYNYYLSRDLERAQEYIEKAIELEPKSVDFHLTKARIWKYYGDSQKASEVMEQARALDTRDRHINTKAAKYQLRNNENEAAIKTVGLFTRAETVGGPLADLHDMQCMWFLTEDGKSYARQKNFGLALKRYTSIYNIFDVWQEDQFDFHAFSLRKGQIRAYIDMVRWEDRLREHPFYTQAALGAVKIYLQIFDAPPANGVNGTDADDASERKKAAKKARKAAQKAEQEAAAKKQEHPNKPVKEGEEAKKVDEDPNGSKLAATSDPLADAMKFLGPVIQFSPKYIEGHLAGFEVAIRRKKYLLALKSLLASAALDKSHPRVHEQSIRFKLAIDADSSSIAPQSLEVIKSEFKLLPSSVDLAKHNDEFLSQNKQSVGATIAGLTVRRLLEPEEKASVDKDVVKVLDLPSITLNEAEAVLELLQSWRSAEAECFRSQAASKWQYATVFKKD